MFKTVPNIVDVQIYLKDSIFNVNLQLSDKLSTVRNNMTKFGVLITESDKQISNYVANYQRTFLQDSKIIFLDKNINFSTKEQNIICNLIARFNYSRNEKNKIVYVTPFYYQEEFKNLNNNIIYTFSNTQEIHLIRNEIIDSKILNYHIIDEINNLNLNSLSINVDYDFGISQLYTSFADRYKANNYFFINHSILSKFQKDKISNIINYNSKIIKNLLKPKIKINNKKENLDYTVQNIQQVNYVQFSDEIYDLSNCEYRIKISYDFGNIYSLFSSLITTYKNKKLLNKEISLLSLINVNQSLYNSFIDFTKKYQKFKTAIPPYNLNKLFENIENYIGKKNSINTLKSNASSSISNPYIKVFKVNVPFNINKFVRISKDNIVLKNGIFTATADLVLFNSNKSYILNNKEMYNLLAINNAKCTKLDFKQLLSTNSAIASSRLLNFSEIKKISKTNLVQDYKITNSIVEIADVITKLPQDIVPQPKTISNIKKEQNNELFRKISHVVNQTLEEYQKVDNNEYHYYYEVALFNTQNLKYIDWRPLTNKSFTGLKRQDKIFCRLMPNIVDLNLQSNIFDFSYNINEVKTVGEMISYVS